MVQVMNGWKINNMIVIFLLVKINTIILVYIFLI